MRPAARLSPCGTGRGSFFSLRCTAACNRGRFALQGKRAFPIMRQRKHKSPFVWLRDLPYKGLLLTLLCLDQLDDGRLSSVAAANAGADDAGIAAIALSIGGGQLLEGLLADVFAGDESHRLTISRQIAPSCRG